MVTQGDAALAVTDFGGTGRGLLLLHGLAGHAGEWTMTAEALSDRARVVAYDARGHGASSAAPMDVSRPAHVADAVAVIAEHQLAPAIVVGQSLGGVTALLLAAEHPELVRALVIAEAGPDCRGNAGAADGLADRLPAWLAERPTGWPQASAAVMERTLRESAGSYWDAWERIRCPTLVVRAEVNGLDEAYVAEMIARLPTARPATIRGAGHDVHLDHPERWHAELRAFVADVGER